MASSSLHTKEAKNSYAHVTTQRSFNKFIELNFSVGCMVWPWCCLFQDSTTSKNISALLKLHKSKNCCIMSILTISATETASSVCLSALNVRNALCLLPQFYIQLVNRPHFAIWILIFGAVWDELAVRKKKWIWVFLSNFLGCFFQLFVGKKKLAVF